MTYQINCTGVQFGIKFIFMQISDEGSVGGILGCQKLDPVLCVLSKNSVKYQDSTLIT